MKAKTAENSPPGTFIAIEGKSKRETKSIDAVRVLIPNSNDTLKTLMKDFPHLSELRKLATQ